MTLGPNLIVNPLMGGGSAPNTAPFGWFASGANLGTVTNTYGYGTDTGIQYIDLILTGTPGAGGFWELIYGSKADASQLSAFGSTVYYTAANINLQAGSWTNAVPQLAFIENDGGSFNTDTFYVGQNTTGSLSTNRFSGSTRTAPNCNAIWGTFNLNFAAATPISLTVRLGNLTIQQDDGLQSGGQRMVGWYQG